MSERVRHLAIIPDGNRRWARAHGLPAERGHARGLETMASMIDTAFEQGVEVFSFWWGSPANLTRRAPAEVAQIRGLLAEFLEHQVPALLGRWGATLRVHGRIAELCPELEGPIARARAQQGPGPRTLVVLMAYDGRDELRAAVAQAAALGAPEQFEAQLWLQGLPPVDLVIRTGAADHLSAGFMLWHLAEARLCFPEPCWPDFTTDALRAALAAHARAPRRFGA
jgi:undecaprenyl diphosphate synthase